MFSIQFGGKRRRYRYAVYYFARKCRMIRAQCFGSGNAIVPGKIACPWQSERIYQQYSNGVDVLRMLPVLLEQANGYRLKVAFQFLVCQFRCVTTYFAQKSLSVPCIPCLNAVLYSRLNQKLTISMPSASNTVAIVKTAVIGSRFRVIE